MHGFIKYIGWAHLVLGLWVMVSPWVVGFVYVNAALWSCLVAGLLIIIGGLWEIFGDKTQIPGA